MVKNKAFASAAGISVRSARVTDSPARSGFVHGCARRGRPPRPLARHNDPLENLLARVEPTSPQPRARTVHSTTASRRARQGRWAQMPFTQPAPSALCRARQTDIGPHTHERAATKSFWNSPGDTRIWYATDTMMMARDARMGMNPYLPSALVMNVLLNIMKTARNKQAAHATTAATCSENESRK